MQENMLNKYSKTFTQNSEQPAAKAMLYGIGFTEEDMHKAQVGIASMGYDGIPVICISMIWQKWSKKEPGIMVWPD